jgi:hypothetical protein
MRAVVGSHLGSQGGAGRGRAAGGRGEREHGLGPGGRVPRRAGVRGVGVPRGDELPGLPLLQRPLPRHQGQARLHVQAQPCRVPPRCTSPHSAFPPGHICLFSTRALNLHTRDRHKWITMFESRSFGVSTLQVPIRSGVVGTHLMVEEVGRQIFHGRVCTLLSSNALRCKVCVCTSSF